MFKEFKSNSRIAEQQPASTETARLPQAVRRRDPLGERDVVDAELQTYLELKSACHEALLDRLNLSVIDKVDRSDLRRQMGVLVTQYLGEQNISMRSDTFGKFVDELMDEVLGLGPLEPLIADPTINDILVNSHRTVFVERFGLLERSPARFRDERHLLRIIDKIVSRIGRRVDESQPWVDARLPDGSRVNAIVRPCSIDGPALSIRKFSRTPITMERMIEIGTLDRHAASFLEGLVKARLNILISGGTGSGKTTMLNAMSAFIDGRQRVVTIEDSAELQLQQEHVVRLETRPPNIEGLGAVTQRDLVRNALRMRPDRIIVGEVRGAECFDMLQAMNTGHDGSMTTVHANTARDALSRLEQMVTTIGADIPARTIRSQIAAGIHVVLQLNRLGDGSRRVTAISEIVGMEGDIVTMQDIFVYKRLGKSATGEVLGRFEATGIRPKCMETIQLAGVEIERGSFIGGALPA